MSARLVASVAALVVLNGIGLAEDPCEIPQIGIFSETFGDALVVQEPWAYIGSFGEIAILDISDHDAIVKIGEIDGIAGSVVDLQIHNGFLIAAAQQGGLLFYDLSDPASPTLAATLAYNTAIDIHIVDDIAFVSDRSRGLRIVDIEDPGDPTEIGFYFGVQPLWRANTIGSLCYLSVSSGISEDIVIVDVSDPTDPTFVAEWWADDNASTRRVVFLGDVALVAARAAGIIVLDVSDPIAPQQIKTIPMEDAWEIQVLGDYAFVADRSRSYLRVLDVADPRNTVQVGEKELGPGESNDLILSNETLYTMNGVNFRVLDVTQPRTPTVVSRIDQSGGIAAVVDGTTLYSANSGGLYANRVLDDGSFVLEGYFDSALRPVDVAVAGQHAFLATGSSGVEVVDVSDPLNMSHVTTFGVGSSATSVHAEGTLLAVGAQEGVRLVDVSDPTAPEVLGSIPIGSAANDVLFHEDQLLALSGALGLVVIDYSDPLFPTIRGVVETPGPALSVTAEDDLALIVDGTSGVQIVSVADPSRPEIIATFDDTGRPVGQAAIVGQAAVVSYSSADPAVLVVDVRDPANPSRAFRLDWREAPMTLTIDEHGPIVIDSGVHRLSLGPCLQSGCPADRTGSSDPNDPTYGVPDGDADADDFFFYLDAFASADLTTCDIDADTDCDAEDFFGYLDLFAAGCP